MVFLQIVDNVSFFFSCCCCWYFVNTLELKFWSHIHKHIRTLAQTGYGIQTQTRKHTHAHTDYHTHTHVSARGRRQKGNREVYCCCRLRRVAWLGRGGEREQGEHVFLSILKRVFSAANCFFFYVCFILWFNWEFLGCCCYQYFIYYFADFLFLSVFFFLLVCCTNCWALFETLDERQLSKTRQLRKIVRPVWLYPNDLMRSTQLFTRPWSGAEPAAAAATTASVVAAAEAAAEPRRQTDLNSQSFQPEDA